MAGEEAVVAAATPAPEVTAQDATPKPEATASTERMFKVVVDGKEQVLPESKIIERAQKGMAAEKDMAEAAQYRQAFTNFVAQSKDPNKMLDLMNNPKALGYSEQNQVALMKAMLASKNPVMVQAIKEWLWSNEVEPSTLTPEQRKMRELESYKSDSEKRDAERVQADKDAKFKADSERFFNEYRAKIWQGLQAAKLPQTELMVTRVARKVQLMRKAGMASDMGKACEFVKMDLTTEYNDQLAKVPDEEILGMLPDGVAEKINKAYLAKLKGTAAQEVKKEAVPTTRQKRPKESKENLAQQLRQLERGQKIW